MNILRSVTSALYTMVFGDHDGHDHDYGMLTPKGNAKVHRIVMDVKNMDAEEACAQASDRLYALATDPKFAEAGDTAVRESVADALKA